MAGERRCNNGHFYNPAKFSSCPHCGVAGIDIGPTRPRPASRTMPAVPAEPQPSWQDQPYVPENRPSPGAYSSDEPTQGWYPRQPSAEGEERVDPIVGWLVCIEGPDRGRDFRIKAEKNFMGRSPSMDICIGGDPRISRDNHAVIAFDPRTVEFRLYAGDARGLVYLNGRMVDIPAVLNAYDIVELGNSKLLFVPFCGERFRWPER